MRALVLGTVLWGAALICAADPAARPAIHLETEEDLASLAATNPAHYLRARRLMAAANVLCQPGRPKLQNADGRDISCTLVLLTSNPPKRWLSFTLDGTPYLALVTLTADRPHPLPAGAQLPPD